jgi:cytochrome c peroxidase
MSCATCHSPQYGYGPPNSLAVQLGSDGVSSGVRAAPSLRYEDMTPAYEDDALNPDGASQNAPGGGFMLDGRAATLADQAPLALLNSIETDNASKAAVVQAMQRSSYAASFQQAFGTGVFDDPDGAFADIGRALQAYQSEDASFHPYSSKFDLYLSNKMGGTLTAAELRGLVVFNDNGNCAACHYAGANFNGTVALMTDFTYQALGVPRNDTQIPNNQSPIPANLNASHYDMGLCGPYRTDHSPVVLGAANSYCGLFKVPTLRNVSTRNAFFHNGVFHSLTQVLHFYNTRDTNPEYWYPATGGDAGNVAQNPSYALFPTYASGATVLTFNDLPAAYQGNVDEEVPMGTGNGGSNTLGSGTRPRAIHSATAMSEQDIQDLGCFLNVLTDGYQPPATQPMSETCVN